MPPASSALARLQFDRHGNHAWKQAGQLLDAQRTRQAVGEVAVAFGRCSEPSNVSAGGGQCPLRLRCLGCEHFSTDVSYLPELRSYLDDLLRTRERLQAMATATVSALTRRAGVDRSFLYRHPDLLAQVHVSATQPPPGGATAPSRASLRADLLAANDRCRRLADQVRVLEHRLSAELGQQVWQRTGIGSPTDIDGLQARILDLEQQALDLKIQLDERIDELEAARSANCELTKIVNQPGRTP